MSKHEIEVEGLPGGYEIELVKLTEKKPSIDGTMAALISVKKKQPRRMVLEETSEFRRSLPGEYCQEAGSDGVFMWDQKNPSMSEYKIWREVEETEDPGLFLGTDECAIILKYGGGVLPGDILWKLYNYIKNSKNNSKNVLTI